MIKKRILTALLIGALLTVGAPSASAEDTTTYVTTGPVFNKPRGTTAEQGAILSQLGRLVNGAQSGSTIRISLYLFGSSWLADQLGAAHRRNVNVQVLVDDDSITDGWMSGSGATVRDKLTTAFAATPPAGTTYGTSWFKVCAANRPCLAKGTGGVNHNKFFLFSRTTGSGLPDKGKPVDNVVVQSSGNLTTWDRESAWNDAMTVADNADLHAGYTRYFDLMAASQALPDGSGRVDNLAIDVEAGPAKGYFFPRSSTDVVENILSMVETPVTNPDGTTAPVCHGNTAGHGTADGRTVIRIANGHISRPVVAEKLWKLADAGCFVDVVHGKLSDYEAEGVHRETAYWLTRSTAKGKISLHRLANDDLKNPADPAVSGTFSHTKYLLIEGSYKGAKDQKLVFTGSHTYTGMALTSNDEALLKYNSPTVHEAYVANFREQRAAALAESQYGGVL
ncbi:phospholipase D-like domain-containing protein [Streptomyces sp. DSM 116496]|uniref:phospholipase D-like domain-containing protein n=1 Tax=Streptomyces stoeckheimensis TaxID=3344656 RepID=UPI0038B2AB56